MKFATIVFTLLSLYGLGEVCANMTSVPMMTCMFVPMKKWKSRLTVLIQTGCRLAGTFANPQ